MRIITTTVADFVVFADCVRIETAGLVGVDTLLSLCPRYLCAAAPAASAAQAKPVGNHPGSFRGEHNCLQQGLRQGTGGNTQWLSSLRHLPEASRCSMPDSRSMSVESIAA
jgi:hypothetical protein